MSRFALFSGLLASSAGAVVHSETFVPVQHVAFWRMEDTIPGAYYRIQNVFADHSGASNHLGFLEPSNDVSYDNSLDGNPAAAACASDTGSGCTYLEYDGGYDTDKSQRADWTAYAGAYRLSAEVPPLAMFNADAAAQSYQITVRDSLYDVSDGTMPAGAGLASFSPGLQSGYGVLLHNATVSGGAAATSLSFDDDFTAEGWFRADAPVAAGARAVLLEQGTRSSHFAYAVDLDDAGALRFAARNQNGSFAYEAAIDGADFADGQWHYFVARYNREAYGAGSMGTLSLKALSEAGALQTALTTTPTYFELATSEEALTLGSTRFYGDVFNGTLDEVRLSEGLVMDADLLGDVAADSVGAAACSGTTTLTDTMGTFSDGSADGAEYVNGLACEWLLQPPSPHDDPAERLDFLALSFSAFGTEPTQDVVEVYDGDSTAAPLLGAFSGYSVPSTPLLSSGGAMLVRFVTDGRQSGLQEGFTADYVSMSLAERECATANEGHTLDIECAAGYVVSAVNFASYGTPEGFCSNGAGAGVGALADVDGYVFNDNSNANGVSDGATAGDGAAAPDAGPVVFNTGYCHSNSSRAVVEAACVGQASCSIAVADATFGGDPCADFGDSKESPTTDGGLPYFHEAGTSKRLFVQATCTGVASFAANCAEECLAKGSCLYALAAPYCDHCTVVGLNAMADGSFWGEGCSSAHCVGSASCVATN